MAQPYGEYLQNYRERPTDLDSIGNILEYMLLYQFKAGMRVAARQGETMSYFFYEAYEDAFFDDLRLLGEEYVRQFNHQDAKEMFDRIVDYFEDQEIYLDQNPPFNEEYNIDDGDVLAFYWDNDEEDY